MKIDHAPAPSAGHHKAFSVAGEMAKKGNRSVRRAKQSRPRGRSWIASSQALLAISPTNIQTSCWTAQPKAFLNPRSPRREYPFANTGVFRFLLEMPSRFRGDVGNHICGLLENPGDHGRSQV